MKTGHPMDQARLAVAAKFTPMMVLDFVVKKGKNNLNSLVVDSSGL